MSISFGWLLAALCMTTLFAMFFFPRKTARSYDSFKLGGSSQTAQDQTTFLRFCGMEEDDDMKIVPETHPVTDKSDGGEDEINRYFRHKRSGNIQLAKDLGEKLGAQVAGFRFREVLAAWKEESFFFPTKDEGFLEDQARMLYVYTGERAAKEYSPDSILRQMVIASLGDCVNRDFPELYTRMAECRAYTVYKLCASRKGGVARYMGEAYAQMVGHKHDEIYIALGSALYEGMTERCVALVCSVDYEP